MATTLYIDADACPVKEEVYRVARRCGLKVFVVSNTWINTPVSYTHLTLPTIYSV